jgi:hypothetical protein
MAFNDLKLRARNLIIELLELHESGEYAPEFYVVSTCEGWVIKLKGATVGAGKELRGFTEGDLIQLEINNYLTHDPIRPVDTSYLSQKAFEQLYLSRAASNLRSRQVEKQQPSYSLLGRTAMANPIQRDQVFFSYSHKDKKWLERFQATLRPLVRANQISAWDDTKIKAGDIWRDEIKRALASAKVAVLLVTTDFLNSDFIAEHELPPLLEAAQNEGLRIFLVVVGDSLFDETELGRYQAVNDPSRPLANISAASRNKEIVRICREIKEAMTSTPAVKQEKEEGNLSGRSSKKDSSTILPQHDWNNPQVACSLLSNISGLQTGGYKSTGVEDDFFCCSPYKDLDQDSLLPNNIAYYAEGDAEEVNRLKLVLNVNDPEKAEAAHRALMTYSNELASRALGEELKPKMQDAILAGQPFAYKVGELFVELKVEAWVTGRGYDMKFMITQPII